MPLIADSIRRRNVLRGLGSAAGFLWAGSRGLNKAAASPAVATGSALFPRRVLERRAIPGTNLWMFLTEVTAPPGGVAPPHHHPVAGLVYIAKGSAESAYGDEAPRVFKTGETMQDLPDIPHRLFRNASKDDSLTFLIFHVGRDGDPYAIADDASAGGAK